MGTGYSATRSAGSRAIAVTLLLAAGPATLAPAGAGASPEAAVSARGTGVTWHLTPEVIAASCGRAIETTRASVKTMASQGRRAESAMAALIAIETVIADMHDALVAQKVLASAAIDTDVREASARCNEALGAFAVEVAADPAIYALARAADREAPADRQLAKRYTEAGRRAGAHLDEEVRAEVAALLQNLSSLEIEFQQALMAHASSIEITRAEAASLPGDIVATLESSPEGYVYPVDFSPLSEQFMTHVESSDARRRYQEAFFRRGGEANSERLARAVALRDRIAKLSGYKSWAAFKLDTQMARTPERALTLLREVDAKLKPRAREEIAALTALKHEDGDETPFAAWDYAYYRAKLDRSRYEVDAEAVRRHFPVAEAVPAMLELLEDLLGIRIERRRPDEAWAPGVQQYAVSDRAGRELLGWFFIDIEPRPGKFQRPATFVLRAGHLESDGGRIRPVAAIIGNGPSGSEGSPALFSHRDLREFLHELGHVMHAVLSTAPYATLHGTNVRGDFVEAPSQMLENFAWQPDVLKRLSSHVETGEAMPEKLVSDLLASKHADAGVFWTRQAFLGVYDLLLHSSGPEIDPNALWFELMPELTPLPPVPGTRPAASFLPVMGGYDAGYYGYVWSRVFAQDLFSAFEETGIDDPKTGLEYRREILEPGGSIEPDELLRNFLGRPVDYAAFYRELGITKR